jgi:hypothetical protein
MNASRCLWLLLFVRVASAQSMVGYAFVAPGGEHSSGTPSVSLATYGLGGGVERTLVEGSSGAFGIGGDVQGLIPGKGQASTAIGILSIDGVYHLPQRGNFEPFLAGGYSVLFRGFTANGGNFGIGANYWFRDHLAFRFEFRGEIASPPIQPYNHPGPTTVYYGVRFGLSFGNRPGS